MRRSAQSLERMVGQVVLAGAEVPLDHRPGAFAHRAQDPLRGIAGRRGTPFCAPQASGSRADGTVLP
ncbi:hypothetical protein GCM10023081_32830 [Arthrobacter ginkgonis]|uniref:Uncharacterized protein n=1 Tax=Arthrobacter ginkgonis TaxID=1630594 RepID=A0ABP7CLH3_9MICC